MEYIATGISEKTYGPSVKIWKRRSPSRSTNWLTHIVVSSNARSSFESFVQFFQDTWQQSWSAIHAFRINSLAALAIAIVTSLLHTSVTSMDNLMTLLRIVVVIAASALSLTVDLLSTAFAYVKGVGEYIPIVQTITESSTATSVITILEQMPGTTSTTILVQTVFQVLPLSRATATGTVPLVTTTVQTVIESVQTGMP